MLRLGLEILQYLIYLTALSLHYSFCISIFLVIFFRLGEKQIVWGVPYISV